MQFFFIFHSVCDLCYRTFVLITIGMCHGISFEMKVKALQQVYLGDVRGIGFSQKSLEPINGAL